MKELAASLFDIFALALPRGHGFGNKPPVSAWQSNDQRACAVVTREVDTGDFGILVMRRRVDEVWTVTIEEYGHLSSEAAIDKLATLLIDNQAPEPLPTNTAPRPALHDLQGRTPSDIFLLLCRPSHQIAGWVLNQLYLSLPNPDENWVSDCQTENFHTRLWEVQLLASFREQGLLVTQPYISPDFHVENRVGGELWIEAVTANPKVRFNHVGTERLTRPECSNEVLLGDAALRFAKTIGSKLQRNYHQLSHVSDKPFALAVADFHASGSMNWSRPALLGYLYGLEADTTDGFDQHAVAIGRASHLLGPSAFPAGLFCNDEHSELSAVIFSNACSIGKLNRVAVSAGAKPSGLRYTRVGEFFDRTPGALKGVPFCLDISSQEYGELWPQGYEPWSAELEVFHNPYAKHPVTRAILPEATHWFEKDGEVQCEAHYETSILHSQTWIQDESTPMPSIGDVLSGANE